MPIEQVEGERGGGGALIDLRVRTKRAKGGLGRKKENSGMCVARDIKKRSKRGVDKLLACQGGRGTLRKRKRAP